MSRQNSAANAPLYAALNVDFVMVTAEVIAHETLARTANPLLMPFLQEVPHQSTAWSSELLERLTRQCGPHLPRLWELRLDAEEAPTLSEWLTGGEATVGDLLRNPADRDDRLDVVALLLVRDGAPVLAPDDATTLERDDRLLLAGGSAARRALEATLHDPPTMAYVTAGRLLGSSWVWRRLAGRR